MEQGCHFLTDEKNGRQNPKSLNRPYQILYLITLVGDKFALYLQLPEHNY